MTSSTWTLSWAGATDQGKVRAQNQDCFHIDREGRFLILADGMGGHSGGEIASERSVLAIKATLEGIDWENPPSPQEFAQICIAAAIDSLRLWVEEHLEQHDMGTTLVVWIRVRDKVVLFSLGDSRIYLLRDGGLFQLTFDQTIESELRRRGATRNQASRSPGAAYLSRCVMANRSCEPDVMEVEIKQGDLWLLCSDGLTREVEDIDIREALLTFNSHGAQLCAQNLIEKALQNGGRDNVTVVAARFE